MKRIAFGLAALLISASPAFAQTSANGVPGTDDTAAPLIVPAAAFGHRGFTGSVDGGFGIQHDTGFQQTQTGFAGINGSLGGFVKDNIAILGRWTSTTVNFSDFGTRQTSGVIGGVLQLWAADRVAIEGGAGLASWRDTSGDSEHGWGLILGVQFAVAQGGPHNLMVGFEYVPVFTPDVTVHNFEVLVGYTYAKKK